MKIKNRIFLIIGLILAALYVLGHFETKRMEAEEQERALLARQEQLAQVQERAAAEKARRDAMTPEERAAEDQAEVEAKAAIEAKKQEQAKLAEVKRLRAEGLVWSYESYPDDLSGKVVETAFVKSTNSASFDFPYQGPQRATLTLRKHPRYGTDVIFQIERGQFVCRVDECTVAIRIDDGAVQKYSAGEPTDGGTTTLFIRNYSRFVGQLAKANEARVSATVYQEGQPTFTFNVAGLEWK